MSFLTKGVLLLVSLLSGVGADCVMGFLEAARGPPVKVLIPQEPKTWDQMKDICAKELDHAVVISISSYMPEVDKEMCGDVLVPVGIVKILGWPEESSDEVEIESLLKLLDESHPRLDEGVGALNLSSGHWHLVSRQFNFTCGICKLVPKDILNMASTINYDDQMPPWQRHKITLASLDVHAEPVENAVAEKKSLSKEIRKVLAVIPDSEIDGKIASSAVPVDEGYQWVFVCHFRAYRTSYDETGQWQALKDAANDNDILRKYEMTVENVETCPEDVSEIGANKTVVWPLVEGGVVQSSLDESSGLFTARQCSFNATEDRFVWASPTFWKIVWEPCTLEEQISNEFRYQEYFSVKHKNVIQQLTASAMNETTLATIGNAINKSLDTDGHISETATKDIEKILLHFPLRKGLQSYVLSHLHVQLAVSDLDMVDPHNGLSLAYNYSRVVPYTHPKTPVAASLISSQRSEKQDGEKFSIQLSDGLTTVSKRLVFVVIWQISKMPNKMFMEKSKLPRFIFINIVLIFKDNVGRVSLDDDQYYVDVAYEPVFSKKDLIGKGCAAWNNYRDGWTYSGCRPLKTDRGSQTLYRCRAKYFFQNGTTYSAKYAVIDEQNLQFELSLKEVFTSHTGLAVSMAIEVILSGLALLSIILTAILFKKWRENPGHKILLHMVMALTINIVLGFATGLMHFDTEGVACLTIGVFRHYSFLSMFLWMLVISSLQLKRLTTVAGAKATSHLILKVASFAWGVPVILLASLLAWNTRFYRSDKFDRGYCYPEGLVFELTVQAPAGVILLVNLGVFVKILRHIFQCTGEQKITKHSKNDSAEKLNRLKTSLFMFVLFGFTWFFHFLSEERAIVSDFLFEYLFLMTATFHLMMLALFFIVLQESTRNLWLVKLDLAKPSWVLRKQAVRKTP